MSFPWIFFQIVQGSINPSGLAWAKLFWTVTVHRSDLSKVSFSCCGFKGIVKKKKKATHECQWLISSLGLVQSAFLVIEEDRTGIYTPVCPLFVIKKWGDCSPKLVNLWVSLVNLGFQIGFNKVRAQAASWEGFGAVFLLLWICWKIFPIPACINPFPQEEILIFPKSCTKARTVPVDIMN